jgi:hypothetical protein
LPARPEPSAYYKSTFSRVSIFELPSDHASENSDLTRFIGNKRLRSWKHIGWGHFLEDSLRGLACTCIYPSLFINHGFLKSRLCHRDAQYNVTSSKVILISAPGCSLRLALVSSAETYKTSCECCITIGSTTRQPKSAMRSTVFFLTLFLFLFTVKAQWGPPDDPDNPDDPQWPGDPDDPPDDDPPWRPTPTQRPTPTPSPTDPEDPDDPPAPIFTGVDVFANATVYQPDDSSHHLTSPRTENLPNNTILTVWNDSAQAQSTLQVYQSTNNGFSWYQYGTVKSTVTGRKLLEPHVLFVEGSWNDDSNITLLAVNAVDAKSTNIELYASYDKGVTFEFVHRVAEGGPVGAKAVGAPHLVFQYVNTHLDPFSGKFADTLAATSASPYIIPIDATPNTRKRSRNNQQPICTEHGIPLLMLWPQMLYLIKQAWPALRRYG